MNKLYRICSCVCIVVLLLISLVSLGVSYSNVDAFEQFGHIHNSSKYYRQMDPQDDKGSDDVEVSTNWGSLPIDLGDIGIGNIQVDEDNSSTQDNSALGASDSSTGRVQRIFFDKVGGQGGTDYVDATFGQPMPKAVAPSRQGFLFRGYWTGEIDLNWEYNKNPGAINGVGLKFYSGESGGYMTSVQDWFLYEHDDYGHKVQFYAMWERIGTNPNSIDNLNVVSGGVGIVMWIVAFITVSFVILASFVIVMLVRRRKARLLRRDYYGYIQSSSNKRNSDWW